MEYIGEKELNNKLNEFKNHLEHADRMILSAKFGDGKSFFLQKVRENTERFSDYEFITIYPVNYIVSSNEDIFEYIKRDILIQLTQLGLLNKIDLNKLITSVFSFENFKEVISFLISCIPGGAVYNKLLDKAFDISKKYSAEKATYEKYFESFNLQKGGLYEDDAYTQMIQECLNLLKSGYLNEKKAIIQKKTVLIIEDLDRLDPAHLFRILNVISAHIDDHLHPDKIGNKFGFNNIVIVMDYDTTQHIFEHFYGEKASYSGYMSKFLSEEPFRYSITNLALQKLKDKIINAIGMDKNWFNALNIMNLKLSALSLRDIARIHDLNLSNRIFKPTFKSRNGHELSTQLPIFKLIIYMTELGMSYADIKKDLELQKNKNLIESIKLIYPLYLICEEKPKYIFDIGGKHINIQFEKKENVISSINSINLIYHNEAVSINVLWKDYASCCRLLTEHIDLAGFNQSSKYSIPGYTG